MASRPIQRKWELERRFVRTLRIHFTQRTQREFREGRRKHRDGFATLMNSLSVLCVKCSPMKYLHANDGDF